MTSLSNECLNSINNINPLISNKEKAVTNAVSEAYDKFFDMIEYNPNLVMEGFLDSIPDREAGEDIFKTIFYFLPRLLKAIVNMLTNLWTSIRHFMMTPEQKALFELAQKTAADRLMSYISSDIFKAEDNGDETLLYIKTRLRGYELIMSYLDQSKQLFEAYYNIMTENAGAVLTNESFKQILLSFSDFETQHNVNTNTTFNMAFSLSPEFVQFDPAIYGSILITMSRQSNETLKTINNIAVMLENYYRQIESDGWDEDVKRLAMNFRNNINRLVREFQENNTKIVNEIQETNTKLQTIFKGIKQCEAESSVLDAMKLN